MMQTTSRACCARMALALLLAVSGCHAASAMPPRAQRKSGAAAAARRTAAVGAAADVFLLDEESHFLAAVNVSGDASVMVGPTPSFTYEVLLTWALRWTLSADADATSVKQAWAAAACTVQRLVRPLLMPTPQLPASASIVSAVVDVTWPSDRGVSLLGARVCTADEGSAAVDASLEQRDALRALRHRGVTADSILRSRPNALLDASWGTHLHVLLKLEASGMEQQQFMPTFLPHLRDTFFHLLTASSAADDAAVAAACALNVSCQRALFTVGNVTHTLTAVLPSDASIMLAATSSAATVSVAMSTLSEAGLAQQLQQSLGSRPNANLLLIIPMVAGGCIIIVGAAALVLATRLSHKRQRAMQDIALGLESVEIPHAEASAHPSASALHSLNVHTVDVHVESDAAHAAQPHQV